MFTEIDHILYPDKCEVLRIGSNYFFPIFKNGSSSLREHASKTDSSKVINQQISKCDQIKVFLRDPKQRFVSGLHTFINKNPNLDKDTIIWFVQNYLFLDRHFLPQFLWLTNLTQFCNEECNLTFYGMEDISLFVNEHVNSINEYDEQAFEILNSKNISTYLQLDDHLLKFVGKSVPWHEIYSSFKQEEKYLYNHIFEKAKSISNAVP